MKTFKEKQELMTRSICDHDCIFDGRVISRTEKTVKLDLGKDGINSFAPIFRA